MNEVIDLALTQVPGLVLATSIEGKREVLAHGHRQVIGTATPIAMTMKTHFDLGSITKIIGTTAALMRLVDDAELSLDEEVGKFLPAWAKTEKSEITVRDLLLHRSGLWEWRPLYVSSQDPDDAFKMISEMPLRYAAGGGYHYSDLGFISLGRILAKIAGNDLKASIQNLVNVPLGLEFTNYAQPLDPSDVAATSIGDSIEREMVISKFPYPVPEDAEKFKKWRENILVGEVNDGNAFHVFNGISGHAGIFSTASDLLTFGEVINSSLVGDGAYSQKVVQEFLTTGPDAGQQLGFRSWIDTYEDCTTEFYGHTGFPGTVLAISPAHKCVAVLLTNRLHVQGNPVATEALWQPFLQSIHRELH